MITASRFADTGQPCTCGWTTRPEGGWQLTDPAANCPNPVHRTEAQP